MLADDENPKIYIAKLPAEIQKGDLEELFNKFGRIVEMVIKTRYAFIVNFILFYLFINLGI